MGFSNAFTTFEKTIMTPPPEICSDRRCRHKKCPLSLDYFRKNDSPPDCYVYYTRCTLTNVKSLTISGKSSISTPSFSPLFTNLSGIVDDDANSLGLLALLHAPAVWPVETCREASLNHKAAAIHQKHFPYDHHFVIVKRELATLNKGY